MTCIVGFTNGKNVYLGADSQGTAGLNYVIRADEKVFSNGAFIFGFTGSFRMGQLLRYKLEIPEQKQSEEDDFRFLVTEFIDAVKSCMKDNDLARIEDHVMSGEGAFLIGYRGNLYSVEADFQVGKSVKPFDAVGCGRDFALGHMYASHDLNISPIQKIKQSLLAAQAFSAGVREPFVIVNN